MKTRMMWVGMVAAALAFTGCQQRDGEVKMQGTGNDAQQGAQGTQAESGTGGMIPERGVQEHTIGGIGGGQQAEENATGGAGQGGTGQQEGGGTGDGSMRRDAELDRQHQEQFQQGETGDQDSNQ